MISIDTASSTPAYEQLFDQITRLAASGQLPDGQRLPTIRQLAADLGLAPGTVQRAYSELERSGVIKTKRAQGTFVTSGPSVERRSSDLLQSLAERFAQQARQLGASHDDAVRAIRLAYGGPE